MYQTFWNYQQKKSGEIVIAKEEIQKMLDQAYQAGYNQAFVEAAPDGDGKCSNNGRRTV